MWRVRVMSFPENDGGVGGGVGGICDTDRVGVAANTESTASHEPRGEGEHVNDNDLVGGVDKNASNDSAERVGVGSGGAIGSVDDAGNTQQNEPTVQVPFADAIAQSPPDFTPSLNANAASAGQHRRGRHRRGGSRGARQDPSSPWVFDDTTVYGPHGHDGMGNPTIAQTHQSQFVEYTRWANGGGQMANDGVGGFSQFDPRWQYNARNAPPAGFHAYERHPYDVRQGGMYTQQHGMGFLGSPQGQGYPGMTYPGHAMPQLSPRVAGPPGPGPASAYHLSPYDNRGWDEWEWELHRRLVAQSSAGLRFLPGMTAPQSNQPQQQWQRRRHTQPGWLPQSNILLQHGVARMSGPDISGGGFLDGGPNSHMGFMTNMHNMQTEGTRYDSSRNTNRLHTVHVRDVHSSVTERDITAAFEGCGVVVDCRLCSDPSGGTRYAFVAFPTKTAARAALAMSGDLIGGHPVRVVLSRTSVVPVNPSLLPQTTEEVERCARTIYVANVDRATKEEEVVQFFTTNANDQIAAVLLQENPRVLSKVAFVEFCTAEGARNAVRCGGRELNGRALRVSQSKTPLRLGGVKHIGAGAVQRSISTSVTKSGQAFGRPTTMGNHPGGNQPAPPSVSPPPGQHKTNAWRDRLQSGDDKTPPMFHNVRVANIPCTITESALAAVFAGCGRILDCRMCGDPHSKLRVAFIAFDEEQAIASAVALDGFSLDGVVLAVRKSNTPIVPVNPDLLPRDEQEVEKCTRTVHVAHICPDVSAAEVRAALESACGGQIENMHQRQNSSKGTQVAFVEFSDAAVAAKALTISGPTIGSMQVWISPSKTPLKGKKAPRKTSTGADKNPDAPTEAESASPLDAVPMGKQTAPVLPISNIITSSALYTPSIQITLRETPEENQTSLMEAEICRLDALAMSSAADDAAAEAARRKSHDSVRSGSSEGDTAVA